MVFVVEIRTDAECRCWPLELNCLCQMLFSFMHQQERLCTVVKCRSLSFPAYLVASFIVCSILVYRSRYQLCVVWYGMVWYGSVSDLDKRQMTLTYTKNKPNSILTQFNSL